MMLGKKLLTLMCWMGAAGAAAGAAFPPRDRMVRWDAGVRGGVPRVKVSVRLTAKGLAANPAKAIQNAVNAAKTPGAVVLPEGTFTLGSSVRMKSGVVLRGQGADKTHLIFNAPKVSWAGAISVAGKLEKKEIAVAGGAADGSTRLTVRDAGGLRAGDTVWLFQENDAKLMYTRARWNVGYGQNSMGQIVKVVKVAGGTVDIDVPLRLAYTQALRPRLRVLRPITNVGIEGLHIKRLDKSEDFIVWIRNGLNCWIRDCHFEWCMRAHVWIDRSRFVTVSGNLMHHAHNYGGGGHGYGVVAASCTSDSLVENNIFHTLRHAMMVKQGATGNVYAYNYSFRKWRLAHGLWLADISAHGHYPHANLFEGNVAEYALNTDYWGPAGPRMTFFRNRLLMPKGVGVKDSSHRANVIGNTLLNGAVTVEPSCKDALVEGNLVGGKIEWNTAPVGTTLPASLYLKKKPAFWGDRPWPGIGADVDAKRPNEMIRIPAEDRWRAMGKGSEK
jgi:parallel beta helix pectate lyase-like protein